MQLFEMAENGKQIKEGSPQHKLAAMEKRIAVHESPGMEMDNDTILDQLKTLAELLRDPEAMRDKEIRAEVGRMFPMLKKIAADRGIGKTVMAGSCNEDEGAGFKVGDNVLFDYNKYNREMPAKVVGFNDQGGIDVETDSGRVYSLGAKHSVKLADGESTYKVGDAVHLGFGAKGGAGFEGVITDIDGDTVMIKHENGKQYKGPVKFLSPQGIEELDLKGAIDDAKKDSYKARHPSGVVRRGEANLADGPVGTKLKRDKEDKEHLAAGKAADNWLYKLVDKFTGADEKEKAKIAKSFAIRMPNGDIQTLDPRDKGAIANIKNMIQQGQLNATVYNDPTDMDYATAGMDESQETRDAAFADDDGGEGPPPKGKYPDTKEGALAFLQDETEGVDLSKAKAYPDPYHNLVWKVENAIAYGQSEEAIVYLPGSEMGGEWGDFEMSETFDEGLEESTRPGTIGHFSNLLGQWNKASYREHMLHMSGQDGGKSYRNVRQKLKDIEREIYKHYGKLKDNAGQTLKSVGLDAYDTDHPGEMARAFMGEGSKSLGSASKKAQKSLEVAKRKAQRWMKRTGKDAEAARKEFDLPASATFEGDGSDPLAAVLDQFDVEEVEAWFRGKTATPGNAEVDTMHPYDANKVLKKASDLNYIRKALIAAGVKPKFTELARYIKRRKEWEATNEGWGAYQQRRDIERLKVEREKCAKEFEGDPEKMAIYKAWCTYGWKPEVAAEKARAGERHKLMKEWDMEKAKKGGEAYARKRVPNPKPEWQLYGKKDKKDKKDKKESIGDIDTFKPLNKDIRARKGSFGDVVTVPAGTEVRISDGGDYGKWIYFDAKQDGKTVMYSTDAQDFYRGLSMREAIVKMDPEQNDGYEYMDDETGQVFKDKADLDSWNEPSGHEKYQKLNYDDFTAGAKIREPGTTDKWAVIGDFGDVAGGGGDPIDYVMNKHGVSMDDLNRMAKSQGYDDAQDWADSYGDMGYEPEPGMDQEYESKRFDAAKIEENIDLKKVARLLGEGTLPGDIKGFRKLTKKLGVDPTFVADLATCKYLGTPTYGRFMEQQELSSRIDQLLEDVASYSIDDPNEPDASDHGGTIDFERPANTPSKLDIVNKGGNKARAEIGSTKDEQKLQAVWKQLQSAHRRMGHSSAIKAKMDQVQQLAAKKGIKLPGAQDHGGETLGLALA